MELPENKLTDFIEGSEKEKWRPVNNHNINNFTEDEIKRITNNYGAPIGKGGFGQVYQGALDDGTTVAVKKYTFQNLKEGFAKEITVHCQINHKNVVRLFGYCSEENALMIVTEYVPRGNLKDLLHGNGAPISLDARLRIAIECADALGYMHSSMYQRIIHGDIKPDNILLDNNLGAKLSDFGLSRLLSMDQTQYTMHVAGSRGYMDPEYVETGLLDPKSDVYSFGVVLLELITRAKASESGFSTGLKRNFTEALRKGKQEARKMFDSEIANERNINILDEMGSLAAECFTREIKERPQMKDVQERLQELRRVLHGEQAQEKIDRGSSRGMHDVTGMVDNGGKNISSSSSKSTVPYKLSILDVFSKNARRYYEQNGGPMVESIRNIRIFTKSSLKRITRNYSQIIGEDAYYRVYLGRSENNSHVVVKKPKLQPGTYDKQNFANAIIIGSRIMHRNIIRVLGCCLETEVPLLVYEFARRGSLHDHLRSNFFKRCLTLDLRLSIAIGSAEALAFLHSKMENQIVHGNVTSRNILLDQDFTPKLSDIVTASSGTLRPNYNGHEFVEGDMAYMDPFYMKTGLLTAKSDVFSFGIVLLELITWKRARYDDKWLSQEYIAVCKKENSGKAMFDEQIAAEGNITTLEDMGKLATQCLNEESDERPEMVEAVERLVYLKKRLEAGDRTQEALIS